MAQVNIQQLFKDKQERLSLNWIAGEGGGAKILDSELVNASNKGLIGHLNLVHPNWVQVLSSTELDYLHTLSPSALDRKSTRLNSSHAELSRMPSSA